MSFEGLDRIQLAQDRGWEQRSRYSNMILLGLGTGRSGDRIPVLAKSTPVQTVPVVHPSSYTICTGSFRGESDCGTAFSIYPYLTPRLKKEQDYTSTSPPGLNGKFYGELLRLCMGFETRHGQEIFCFPDPSRLSPRPNHPLVQGVTGFLTGAKATVSWL